jgi:hypothetical protein
MELESMLTAEEVAKLLRVDVQTLAKWRVERRRNRKRVPLSYMKAGGRVLYAASAIKEFFASRTYTPGEPKRKVRP